MNRQEVKQANMNFNQGHVDDLSVNEQGGKYNSCGGNVFELYCNDYLNGYRAAPYVKGSGKIDITYHGLKIETKENSGYISERLLQSDFVIFGAFAPAELNRDIIPQRAYCMNQKEFKQFLEDCGLFRIRDGRPAIQTIYNKKSKKKYYEVLQYLEENFITIEQFKEVY